MQRYFEIDQLRHVLSAGGTVDALHPEETVFSSMLGSWAHQQRARNLSPETISGRVNHIRRFADYAGSFPWSWRAADMDDFSGWMVSKGLAHGTIRQIQGSVGMFCDYLVSPAYDWVEICESRFGEAPSQICHLWNTAKHVQDYEGSPRRRALTYDELQSFFDHADSKVEAALSGGRKGALAALRDAQMFKTAYAFGLRRGELRGLDVEDLHFNASVPQWGSYAALHVRFAKSSKGSTPKRRTVLLVPEMAWWIEGMRQWIEQGRELFNPEGTSAMWLTERRGRVSLEYVDRRFTALRRELGWDQTLTLHCLRHSYVTHLIEHGYAERFVQEQVGHSHASTTAIYTSVSGDFKNRILKDAIRRFNDLEEQ